MGWKQSGSIQSVLINKFTFGISMKDVAVIILNWNGLSLLKQFLPSVVSNSGDAQIIIADNGSTDDSNQFIQENYPSVRIVISKTNGGFAKGYNDALKEIDSKFYVLLNNDVEVTPNWLESLYKEMGDESVTGCQPKILSHSKQSHFEHAGAAGGYLDKNYFPFCRGRIFGQIEKDSSQYDSTKEIFWATGAAFMIRSKAFHIVGGFDEDFFAHMEEIDLCWRLKKMNHRFLVVPSSIVYHVGGGTLEYNSPNKVYLNFRNSLIMIGKNHSGLLFPKLIWRMILDGLAAAVFLFKGQFKQFFAVVKAHFWLYGHIGSVVRKRKEIKKSSTEFNDSGVFNGNIIWHYYGKGIKTFDKLNQRLFR